MAPELRLGPMFERLNASGPRTPLCCRGWCPVNQHGAFRAESHLQLWLQEHLPAQPSFPVQRWRWGSPALILTETTSLRPAASLGSCHKMHRVAREGLSHRHKIPVVSDFVCIGLLSQRNFTPICGFTV